MDPSSPASSAFASGVRMTRQRRVILEELRALRSHPSADELYEIVRRRLPRISLGTVYRNLDLLAREGAVLRLEQPCGGRRFDGDTRKHYHVRCSCCGKVDDIFVEPPAKLHELAGKACGYEIENHRLEFTGICPRCRRKMNGRKN